MPEQMESVSSLLSKAANFESEEADKQTVVIKKLNAVFNNYSPKSAQW